METKTLPRREREKIRQRNEMLEAALRLFSEKGYHNVSMHEIAQEAEYAIGTLYRFFQNKEDLYKALMMAKAEQYHNVLKQALANPRDVLATVKRYVAAKGKMFAGDLRLVRLYFAETRGASFNIKAGFHRDIRKLYDEVMRELADVFAQGVRAKVFRPFDPYSMAIALEGITNSFLLSWFEDPDKHPYEDNVPVILDLFLKGSLAQ